MSLQAEIIKEELAMIKYELDCAREDWKKFPHSLRNIQLYQQYIKENGS